MNLNLLKQPLSDLTTLLLAKKLTITTAESCTGGMVAALLTELSGSSAWFERGFVTYSNASKQELLGVDAGLIREFGAVSIPVAEAMALGALHHSRATVSLAVTGIAGPDGGTAEKPVGTVCFAFAGQGMPLQSERCIFPSVSRQEIRHLSCVQALRGMLVLLK